MNLDSLAAHICSLLFIVIKYRKISTRFSFYDLFDIAGPKDRTYGKHGYDNRLRNMGAVFIARGQGFQNGGKETSPFENVDIYPLICHLLSISCNPNNGTIGHMLDILQRSSAFYTHWLFSIFNKRCKVEMNSNMRMNTYILNLILGDGNFWNKVNSRRTATVSD